jgi:acetyl-CoA acetyltransferase
MTTLVNGLEQRGKRYGLQTMREVGGMANAGIFERLDEITPDTNEGARQ